METAETYHSFPHLASNPNLPFDQIRCSGHIPWDPSTGKDARQWPLAAMEATAFVWRWYVAPRFFDNTEMRFQRAKRRLSDQRTKQGGQKREICAAKPLDWNIQSKFSWKEITNASSVKHHADDQIIQVLAGISTHQNLRIMILRWNLSTTENNIELCLSSYFIWREALDEKSCLMSITLNKLIVDDSLVFGTGQDNGQPSLRVAPSWKRFCSNSCQDPVSSIQQWFNQNTKCNPQLAEDLLDSNEVISVTLFKWFVRMWENHQWSSHATTERWSVRTRILQRKSVKHGCHSCTIYALIWPPNAGLSHDVIYRRTREQFDVGCVREETGQVFVGTSESMSRAELENP